MSQLLTQPYVRSSRLMIIFTVLLMASSSALAQKTDTLAPATNQIAVTGTSIQAVAGTRTSASDNVTSETTGKMDKNASGPKADIKKPDAKDINSGDVDEKPDARKTSDAERMDALEKALREQNERIEKMDRIIADQQKTIQQLSGRSTDVSTARQPQSAASAVPRSDTTENPITGNGQTQTIDDRLKKVEGDVLKIGPIRFSGDFRLRFDGIFRKSDPTPPAGFSALSLVQNVRARYRFRLNMDTDISDKFSFHAQLATGPANNPLTNDQDFTSTVERQTFSLNEAWIDYHPNKSIDLQGGHLQEVFADNSRFLFDDDVRFNGFNEKYVMRFKNAPGGFTSIDFRAGQYIFSSPNVAVVTAGSPLATAGAIVGSIGRSSNLFHQGMLVNHQINKKFTQQFGADLQIYRNPNQIQLASTAAGVVLIVYPGLGITLSGPLGGTGNPTTTPGGAIYSARSFEIARLTYKLNYSGFKWGDHDYPVTFNLQGARNVGIGGPARDAMLAALQIGKITKHGDMAFLYIFSRKDGNSMISQLTDDDLGTNSGVNIRTHHFRFDYGVSKKISLQSLFYIQKEINSSGDFPNFFVPLNAFTPRQFRMQEQIVFTF